MNRDEATKKSDDAIKELVESLKQGYSDKLIEYLGTMARFHQYSFGNCILIYLQKSDATFVAAFGRWLQLKRYPSRGGEVKRTSGGGVGNNSKLPLAAVRCYQPKGKSVPGYTFAM